MHFRLNLSNITTMSVTCESLDNLTPADVYFGREKGVFSRREQIKNKTLSERRIHYFNAMCVYNVQ